MHDGPHPTTTRRRMAFADAVFDGRAALEGAEAVRLDTAEAVEPVLATRAAIPIFVGDLADLLRVVRPDVLIDARMRKRVRPETQRGLAPLTVGLGPNFVAGETVDLPVETAWGDDLGRVLRHGAARPLEGEPRSIGGHGRDRYVYSPVSGVFRTDRAIGERVQAGMTVARVDGMPILAPLDGVLKGLVRDRVPVDAGVKVIEVDPRGPDAVVSGIGERPGRIADGVLAAVLRWAGRRGTASFPVRPESSRSTGERC
ncbi:MAG: hypothetical protein M3Q71_09205 [Chloroflexota bacterium]|nr:hypothetical protein [Chloroflexota bacterium]